MNISLTPHFEDFIKAKMATGQYSSASEVVREALRQMENGEKSRAQKLEDLKAAIQEGIDSGPGRPYDHDRILEMAKAKAR